jgi:hypothetical protein
VHNEHKIMLNKTCRIKLPYKYGYPKIFKYKLTPVTKFDDCPDRELSFMNPRHIEIDDKRTVRGYVVMTTGSMWVTRAKKNCLKRK